MNIVDITLPYVKFKKSGNYLVGKCPLNDNEVNDSFVVSPLRNIFYCFTCKAASTPEDFIKRIDMVINSKKLKNDLIKE